MAGATSRLTLRCAALVVALVVSPFAAERDVAVADAAERGDAAAVVALLKQGADVNTAQGDGMTALHWAAMNGDASLTTLLLGAGANARAATRINRYTPLMLAARQGHGAVVEALLEGGADPDVATENGTTVLMFAAASGDVASVEAVARHGVDLDARETVRGLTAAMFAAAANHATVITALGKAGADLAAASDPLDLRVIDRSRFKGVLFGNPVAPKAPGDEAGSVEGGGRNGNATGRNNGPGAPPAAVRVPGVDRDFSGNELVNTHGGMTPLLFAARQGYVDTALALLDAGVDINQPKIGDETTPLLMATINGHFDLAKMLLERGADPNRSAINGITPLYAVINLEWSPRAGGPKLRAYKDQTLSYLDMMMVLLDKGADPNARLATRVWYGGNLSGVNEQGASPFWRAAYASDLDAMRLLVARGADPNIPTMKGIGRPPTDDGQRDYKEVSNRPPVPVGGPGVPPLVAAAGVGYGEGFAGNTHNFAPTGMMAAVKYLVEELGADVNAVDHEGNTAMHNAAARGDVEMILYLVSKGADPTAVNREGKSTADMANGPVQRIQPWPEALALLEKLGAVNHHRCVSC
ncbi:MAG: ankyrin repeat domain-containing protein [Acidobacteriota bacterium]|nr:ankyrin repeat domain-containing protein [Acidobacteriota bacterium]